VTIADFDVQTWRNLPAIQQPKWPDPLALRDVLAELCDYPPLVFPTECDQLRARLAAVARGEAFLLQGGDCAETFDAVTVDQISNKIKIMAQIALVLTYATSVPVVKIGRIAGQYAKPRSKSTETRQGTTLSAYRGDAVNGIEFTPQARTPNPERLKRMYHISAVTLDLIRGLLARGYADPRQVHMWDRNFVGLTPAGRRYGQLAREIDKVLHLVRGGALDSPEVEFYISHEALLLDYEDAMTRPDQVTGDLYDLSAHMVWIGERTRRLDGAHVEFASKVRNPIGVKLGPTCTPDDALALIDKLDPEREPGRLTFITRMGAHRIRDVLPTLVEKVTAAEAQVAWVCDPMHGNTLELSGHKTRRFEDVLDEVTGFFEVHRALGAQPAGIHIELAGDDVTECVGGGTSADDLHQRYETACDPRLNRSQSLELAFHIADLYRVNEQIHPKSKIWKTVDHRSGNDR
jgi:3-deoxy-7-phosphoheptulonate synthase